MGEKQKFYSLKNILARNAQYNMIIGERSNGKTYAVLKYGLKKYVEEHKQMAIVRRWQDDFIGKRGSVMFDSLVSNSEITNLTNGEWTNIYYYSSRWYLCRFEDKKRILDERPFCYGFSLTSMEHDKSTSYPDITTICFDEFLTRTQYVPDEFVLFMNVLSTIIRQRKDVKIFMLGNTVNKYCPYFAEMGLTHIKKMKPGNIDVYQYGESELKVAVEYTMPSKKGKKSDLYFAFDNPKLNMITGGEWEIDIYPHLPYKYKPKDIVFRYYIEFNNETLECEVIVLDKINFTFIHPKTTPIKDRENQLIYSTDFSPYPTHLRYINRPKTPLENRIITHFKNDKVYYATNETGELVMNYLKWCGKK